MDVLSLFSSKILRLKNPNPSINPMLASMALHHHERLGILRTENHNIWDWDCPEIRELKDFMVSGYEQWADCYGHQLNLQADPDRDLYIRHAWAQVYREGGYAKLHSHQMADATAVYYVTSHEKLRENGQIEIHDPRWVSDEMLYVENEQTSVDIYPEAGTLLIIPGNLWHSVPAYLGTEPRICYVSTFEYSIVRRSR
jgi:hypothetical protein